MQIYLTQKGLPILEHYIGETYRGYAGVVARDRESVKGYVNSVILRGGGGMNWGYLQG